MRPCDEQKTRPDNARFDDDDGGYAAGLVGIVAEDEIVRPEEGQLVLLDIIPASSVSSTSAPVSPLVADAGDTAAATAVAGGGGCAGRGGSADDSSISSMSSSSAAVVYHDVSNPSPICDDAALVCSIVKPPPPASELEGVEAAGEAGVGEGAPKAQEATEKLQLEEQLYEETPRHPCRWEVILGQCRRRSHTFS